MNVKTKTLIEIHAQHLCGNDPDGFELDFWIQELTQEYRRIVSEHYPDNVRQHNTTLQDTTLQTIHNTTLQESFNLFWKEYPRKVGKGKCEKIWEKIKPDSFLYEKISKMQLSLMPPT